MKPFLALQRRRSTRCCHKPHSLTFKYTQLDGFLASAMEEGRVGGDGSRKHKSSSRGTTAASIALPKRSSLTSLAAFSPSSLRFLSIILLRSTAALSSALRVQPILGGRIGGWGKKTNRDLKQQQQQHYAGERKILLFRLLKICRHFSDRGGGGGKTPTPPKTKREGGRVLQVSWTCQQSRAEGVEGAGERRPFSPHAARPPPQPPPQRPQCFLPPLPPQPRCAFP